MLTSLKIISRKKYVYKLGSSSYILDGFLNKFMFRKTCHNIHVLVNVSMKFNVCYSFYIRGKFWLIDFG